MWAYGPGVEPGEDDSRVAVYDLYPTITNLFGIDAGKGSVYPDRGPDGESFVSSLGGVPAYRRFTYVDHFPLFSDPRTDPVEWQRTVRGPRFKFTDVLGSMSVPTLWDHVSGPAEENSLLEQPLGAEGLAFLRLTRDVLGGL